MGFVALTGIGLSWGLALPRNEVLLRDCLLKYTSTEKLETNEHINCSRLR
jgi:ubiquitin C-terminal hydrolase